MASLGAPSKPMGASAQPAFSDLGEISIWLHRVALAQRHVTTNHPTRRKRRIMPSSEKPVLTAIGAIVLGVSLAACGGATTAGPSTPVPAAEMSYVADPGDLDAGDPVPVDPAPVVVERTPAKVTAKDAAKSTPKVPKVSANTASEDAIAAALKAVGVGSPNKWAAEVVEYRPYAADDLDLTKLKDSLLKYNPTQKTLDQILSVLLP